MHQSKLFVVNRKMKKKNVFVMSFFFFLVKLEYIWLSLSKLITVIEKKIAQKVDHLLENLFQSIKFFILFKSAYLTLLYFKLRK